MHRLLASLLLALGLSVHAYAQDLKPRFEQTYDSLFKIKAFDGALETALAWEADAIKSFGDSSLERVVSLGKIGAVKREVNQLAEADSIFLLAFAMAKTLKAEETTVYADLLSGYSILKQNMGKSDEAIPFAREAFAIRTKILGDTDKQTLLAQSQLVAALLRVAATDEAEQILNAALTTCKRNNAIETPEYANFLHNYGALLSDLGRFNRAWATFRDCLVLRKKLFGDQSFEYWHTLFKFCTSLIAGNNIEELTPLLEVEKSLNAKLFAGKKTTRSLASIQLRGAALMAMRVYDKAIITFEEAKILVVEMSMKNSQFYSNFCYNTGLAYDAKFEFEQADLAYLEALQIEEIVSGKSSANYIIYLLGRAQMLVRWNKVPESESLLHEVAPYFEENPESIYYFYFLQAKADLALKQEDITEGIAICDKVIQEGPEKLGPNHDLISTFLEKKAIALFDHGYPEKGALVMDDFIKVIQAQFFSRYALLTDEERYEDFQGFVFGIEMLANAALKSPEIETAGRLANLQLFAKNMLETTTRKLLNHVQNMGKPAITEAYVNWMDAYEQLSDAYQFSPEELTAQGIGLKILEEEVKKFEQKLSSQGVPIIRQEKTTEWTNIRDALQAGESAIDVLRFRFRQDGGFHDTIIYAFSIIKPDAKQPALVFLENGNDLESFGIGQYQNEITRKKDLSANLYEKMWAPVAAQLQGVKTVYFSPDGIFHKINLNTLRAADGTYLLDNIQIKQVTNLRNILDRGQEASGSEPGMAALFGNPAFKTVAFSSPSNNPADLTSRTPLYRDIAEDAKGDFHLSPLPGSEREVNAIAKKLTGKNWKATVFTGAKATEDTLKQLRSPKVLHIATHGYFLNAEKPSSKNGLASPYAGENPALRSMLFLAGAENSIAGENTGRNDGILTAFEAAVLNLDQTELVVLSACNTGLGKIQNGEGVFGLQRAFRIAGAKSLFMSLWEVEDAATELLMNAFYENWLSGMSKTEAFRKAQLALKAKYPQPFYWGSFVLVNG